MTRVTLGPEVTLPAGAGVPPSGPFPPAPPASPLVSPPRRLRLDGTAADAVSAAGASLSPESSAFSVLFIRRFVVRDVPSDGVPTEGHLQRVRRAPRPPRLARMSAPRRNRCPASRRPDLAPDIHRSAGYRRRWADRTRTRGRGKLGGERESNLTPGMVSARGVGLGRPRAGPRGNATRARLGGASKRSRSTVRSPSFAAPPPEVPRVPASTPPRAIPKAQPPLCTRGSYPTDRTSPPRSGFRRVGVDRASTRCSTATRPTTRSSVHFARFDPNAQPDASPTPRVRM